MPHKFPLSTTILFSFSHHHANTPQTRKKNMSVKLHVSSSLNARELLEILEMENSNVSNRLDWGYKDLPIEWKVFLWVLGISVIVLGLVFIFSYIKSKIDDAIFRFKLRQLRLAYLAAHPERPNDFEARWNMIHLQYENEYRMALVGLLGVPFWSSMESLPEYPGPHPEYWPQSQSTSQPNVVHNPYHGSQSASEKCSMSSLCERTYDYFFGGRERLEDFESEVGIESWGNASWSSQHGLMEVCSSIKRRV